MIQQRLIIAIIGVGLSTMANATCTIKYACGTGATGTAPSQHTVSSGSVFTPAANTCTRDGYVFSHYLAVPGNYTYVNDGVAQPGTEYTIPFKSTSNTCTRSVTLTLTAQWVEQNPSKTTSKKYTDAQLATRQPTIAGNGADKLMLFSDTIDGAVLSRDIVTTLGTPDSNGLYSNTDADSAATRGAINTGLNRKQGIVIGQPTQVTRYTGTAGIVGSKPVYNSTSQYGTALIQADTLNAAVTNAVNSELTQIDETGTPSSTGTLWRINDNVTLLAAGVAPMDLLALVNVTGMGHCYKKLSDGTVSAGTCTTAPSGYGNWGTTFDVNGETVQVNGISACGTVNESLSQGGIPTNQSGVQADYVTSGSGATANPNPPGGYCYCKVNDSAAGWVFAYSNSVSSCASNCAGSCASYVRNISGFRGAVFGAN